MVGGIIGYQTWARVLLCLSRASVPGVSCAVRYLDKPRWRAVGYSETPLLLSESVMSHPFPQNLLNDKDNARQRSLSYYQLSSTFLFCTKNKNKTQINFFTTNSIRISCSNKIFYMLLASQAVLVKKILGL